MELELTADAMRERVTAIALALPEATATSLTGQHSAFEVRGKKFAYFLVDHHGDGRLAINCKTVPGAASAMVADNPERYFNPAYLGAKGWVGLDLNAGGVEWDEVERLLRESYLLIAPKQLVARAAAVFAERPE